MKFGPITVKDKLGREVVLRNAEATDAEDLINYLKVTTAETPYLIREPDEVTLTVEQEKNFICGRIEADRELMLIATIDGKHVGNCSLMGIGSFRRYRHRCDVAIALYQEYCGAGIGRIMMETVLEEARKYGYEQALFPIVQGCVYRNKPAISLYESLGFRKYGGFPDNMKYADGTYTDAWWMMKKL